MNINLSTAARCYAALWPDAALPGSAKWRSRSALMIVCGGMLLAGIVSGRAYLTRNAALQREIAALEARSANLATLLAEAEVFQPRFAALLDQPKRLLDALSEKGWTLALRVVVRSVTADIQLRDISVRPVTGTEVAHLMRLEGVAVGDSPRMLADQFRSRLQRGLEEEHFGKVETQFERLDDASPSAIGSSPAQTHFAISITLGAMPSTGGGGRGS